MVEALHSDRVQVSRMKDRGAYDQAAVYRVLDEGKICHVGFVVDNQPYVIPMAYARIDDKIILHGSVLSRLMKSLSDGVSVCVTVTHLDAMVLARSAFHHSMNYRSAVVLGQAKLITEPEIKAEALDALVDHLIPGRSTTSRPSSVQELKATSVLELVIEEASVKQRSGPPKDDKEDLQSDYWAGLIPVTTVFGAPQADADLAAHIKQPDFSALLG